MTWSRNSSSPLVVMGVLTVGLAAVFSSPDRRRSPWRDWAKAAPADVVATAAAELAGTTRAPATARHTTTPARVRSSARCHCRSGVGSASRSTARTTWSSARCRQQRRCRSSTARCALWQAASADQQTEWASAYSDALAAAPDGDPAQVKSGDYGPVPALAIGSLLWPQRCARGAAHHRDHVLRRRRDPAAAAARRRRLPRGPGPRPPSRRRPVGDDERDRQLPWPALDVALHVLVPGQAVLHLRQRRRSRLGR